MTDTELMTRHDEDRAENDRLRTRVESLEAVLGYREAELLRLKGPCSNSSCRLHGAHDGPCFEKGKARV